MRTKFISSVFLFLFALGAYFAIVAKNDFEYTSQGGTLVSAIAASPENEGELLPDIVPLPAYDVSIEKRGNERYLRFSTTYFNQGDGSLDLVADPRTKGIREDIEREVFQHIQKVDGSIREKKAGKFEWHEEHLHFHFADFVLYELSPVDTDASVVEKDLDKKATFCVRDVSKVLLEIPNTPDDAEFKICLRERQGVSVGWGDTYLYNYPDQDLDITNLPTGEYELSFLVNPKRLLEESNYNNNRSTAKLFIDMEKLTVKILDETPKNSPEIEHVYLEQPFGEGN